MAKVFIFFETTKVFSVFALDFVKKIARYYIISSYFSRNNQRINYSSSNAFISKARVRHIILAIQAPIKHQPIMQG